jgi:hypothetical protein
VGGAAIHEGQRPLRRRRQPGKCAVEARHEREALARGAALEAQRRAQAAPTPPPPAATAAAAAAPRGYVFDARRNRRLQVAREPLAVATQLAHDGGPVSDEVIQLYGSYSGAAGSGGLASPPLQQLLAFERRHDLTAGSRSPVAFTLPAEALALVAPDGVMRVSPGRWTLTLGGGPPSNRAYGGGDVLVGYLDVA